MDPERPSRSPARLVGAFAVLLLLVGIGLAVWQWQRARPPQPTPPLEASPGQPSGENAVEQALALAKLDSAAIKSQWVDEVSGVSLAGLSPGRREIFLRFANAERCTCGCGYTLAGCRASDMSCEVSGPRLNALLDSVRTGQIAGAAGIRERPRSVP